MLGIYSTRDSRFVDRRASVTLEHARRKKTTSGGIKNRKSIEVTEAALLRQFSVECTDFFNVFFEYTQKYFKKASFPSCRRALTREMQSVFSVSEDAFLP